MRFSTLVRDHGPVVLADRLTDKQWQASLRRGTFATVYHGESDWATPLVAVVGHHGCVNTLCKISWQKPLPAGVTEINGMRNNQEAFDLFNS